MKLPEQRDRKHQIRFRNDDAVPCQGKLLKISVYTKPPAEIFVPFGGSDAALLPVQPKRVALNRGVEFAASRFATTRSVGVISTCSATCHLGDVTECTQRLELNDDPADIENDGVNALICGYSVLPATCLFYAAESATCRVSILRELRGSESDILRLDCGHNGTAV